MIFCENCGKQLNDGVKFCSGCGSAIGSSATPTCASCRKSLEIGQKFCDGCGTSVGGSSQTQHYVPPAPQVFPPAPQVFAPVTTATTTIRENRFRSNNGDERNIRIGNTKFNKYDEPSLSKNTPNSNNPMNQAGIGKTGSSALNVLKSIFKVLGSIFKFLFRALNWFIKIQKPL